MQQLTKTIASEDGLDAKQKKKKDESPSKRRAKEDVDDIFEELTDKHGSTYTTTQLRLWARMLHCGTYDSLHPFLC